MYYFGSLNNFRQDPPLHTDKQKVTPYFFIIYYSSPSSLLLALFHNKLCLFIIENVFLLQARWEGGALL